MLAATCIVSCTGLHGQVLTPEDSLSAGLIQRDVATVLSGYGELRYAHHVQTRTAEAGVPRAVLYVGHRFNRRISLFSEFEVENAKVSSEAGNSGDYGLVVMGTHGHGAISTIVMGSVVTRVIAQTKVPVLLVR